MSAIHKTNITKSTKKYPAWLGFEPTTHVLLTTCGCTMLLVSQRSPIAIRSLVDVTWPSDSIRRPPDYCCKVSTWLIAWSTTSRSINNLAGGMLDRHNSKQCQALLALIVVVSVWIRIFFRKKPIKTPVISPYQIGHQFDVFEIVVGGGREEGISEGSNPAEMAATTSISLLCQCRQWPDILARQTEKCR